MTYSAIPDFYFSTKWLSFGLPFVLILVAVILLQAFEYKSKLKKMLVITLFPLAFLLLITAGSLNPMWMGYGKPVEIVSTYRLDNQLIVLDYIMSAGGKSSRGAPYYRIHVLDPASGAKKMRFTVGGKGELVGLSGDTLAYAQYQNVSFYSISSGKKIKEWTAETLPSLFPELQNGVFQFETRDRKAYATSTDGTKWILIPLSQRILAEKDYQEPAYHPSHLLYVKDNYIYYDDKQWGTEVLELKPMKGNDLLKFITKEDSICNKELSFLHGNIVGLSHSHQNLIIKHYNTTDKMESAYSAVSNDGQKLLWQLKSSLALPTLSDQMTVDDQAGVFFFSSNREVICASLWGGWIIWRTRL